MPVKTSIRTGTAQGLEEGLSGNGGAYAYDSRYGHGHPNTLSVAVGQDQMDFNSRQNERLCCDLTILTVIQMSLILISLFIGVWALIRTYEI